MDLKADYVPLDSDPKLVDADTLEFLNKKTLSYFGISKSIYINKYTEEEFDAFYEGTIKQFSIQLSEEFSRVLLTKEERRKGEQLSFIAKDFNMLLGLKPVEGGNKRPQSFNFVNSTKANLYQVGEEDKKDSKES